MSELYELLEIKPPKEEKIEEIAKENALDDLEEAKENAEKVLNETETEDEDLQELLDELKELVNEAEEIITNPEEHTQEEIDNKTEEINDLLEEIEEKIEEESLNLNIYDLEKNINIYKFDAIEISRPLKFVDEYGETVTKYTSIDKPIYIKLNFFEKTLFIDDEWLLQNKDKDTNLISYIVKNLKNDKIRISTDFVCFITKELIKDIASNTNLKKVYLDGYTLTYEDYMIFKKSSIEYVETDSVSHELQDVFDPIIGFNMKRKLIDNLDYKDLMSDRFISLKNHINDEELKYFQYLNKECTIFLKNDVIYDLEKIRKIGLTNKIILNIEDKNLFNNFLFKFKNNTENVFVKYDKEEVSLKKYIELEELLYFMIEPVKNLSTFEKFIYAFNIVKQYKEYKEELELVKEEYINIEASNSSRCLYKILENEYIVCVGFANFLRDLLDKLGIPNFNLGVDVDTSYDKIKNKIDIPLENKPVKTAGHARVCCYIKDEKYGIDGFYTSDPTWDNDLQDDYYNHLALTSMEINKHRSYNFFTNDINELFDITSMEEFYGKIDILLRKGKISNSYSEIIEMLIDQIKKIDSKYVDYLKQKYDFINYSYREWPDITDLVKEVGNYILNKVNNLISGETIMSAVKVLYENFYGLNGEQVQEKLKDTLEKNNVRQQINFPKRAKAYTDANGETVVSEIDEGYANKFDIDINDIYTNLEDNKHI